MITIDNAYLQQSLRNKYGEQIISAEETYGMLTIVIKRELIIDMLTWLKGHSELQFNFLTDLCGVNFPAQKDAELGVVYHIHSLINNIRLRIQVFFSGNDANIPTASNLFAAAGWMERETYDFFGINFTGHVDMRRILNVDDMNYFPMLKQYPLEDATRTDKEDKYFGR